MRNAFGPQRATARRSSRMFGFALLTLCLGSPAIAEAAPTPVTEPAPEESEDGLQLVPIEGPGAFWVRPDVDLGAYDRVALKPIHVEYKGTPRHYRIEPGVAGVLLTERDYRRLQRAYYKAFKTGLAGGRGFGPASRSDAGLLWVSTSLVDVVVRNKKLPVNSDTPFAQDFGEMTLRVEFSDSQTGETIARFEEHRTIGPSSDFIDRLYRPDFYTYWTAVRANLARWSELVRRRMHDQRAATTQF